MTGTATKLAILVEGALEAGARDARPIKDEDGDPATLTECGHVLPPRVINEEKEGFVPRQRGLRHRRRGSAHSSDRLFTVQEHGGRRPSL